MNVQNADHPAAVLYSKVKTGIRTTVTYECESNRITYIYIVRELYTQPTSSKRPKALQTMNIIIYYYHNTRRCTDTLSPIIILNILARMFFIIIFSRILSISDRKWWSLQEFNNNNAVYRRSQRGASRRPRHYFIMTNNNKQIPNKYNSVFVTRVSGNRAIARLCVLSRTEMSQGRLWVRVCECARSWTCVHVCAKQCTFLREVRFGLIKTCGRRRKDRRERVNSYYAL